MDSSDRRTPIRYLECLDKVAPEPCFDRETFGSPEFPGYPLEQMTRSQTPVVTLNTCLGAFRSAAFQNIKSVGFRLSTHVGSGLSNDHNSTFFGAQY